MRNSAQQTVRSTVRSRLVLAPSNLKHNRGRIGPRRDRRGSENGDKTSRVAAVVPDGLAKVEQQNAWIKRIKGPGAGAARADSR